MKLKPSNNVPKRGSYTSKCVYVGTPFYNMVCSMRTDCNPQDKLSKGTVSAFLLEKTCLGAP